MIKRKTKFAMAFAVALCAVSAPMALAAADTDDSLSPASTVIKATLKAGTVTVLTGTVNGVPVTSNCTGSSVTFKTLAKGLGPVVTSNPTFTGCTDNLGGTDTVRSSSTNGRWTATYIDAPNDEAKETATGDKIKLTMPKQGVTIQSSLLSGCAVIAAPTAPASITAAYNETSHASVFSKASIPTAGFGCTTGPSGAFSANYIASGGLKDGS